MRVAHRTSSRSCPPAETARFSTAFSVSFSSGRLLACRGYHYRSRSPSRAGPRAVDCRLTKIRLKSPARPGATPRGRQSTAFAPQGIRPRKVRFAGDSPLEGDGFEIPVPRQINNALRRIKHKGAGGKFIDQGRHRRGARHRDGRGQRRPAPAGRGGAGASGGVIRQGWRFLRRKVV